MSEKNALAILGSPHTNGTTAAMLNFAVHKAEQAGYAVTKITLYEKNLSFCTGCRICMDTHICVQRDGHWMANNLFICCQMILDDIPLDPWAWLDDLAETDLEEMLFFKCGGIHCGSQNGLESHYGLKLRTGKKIMRQLLKDICAKLLLRLCILGTMPL